MIDLLPKPVSPDAVKPLLERGERLVSSFGPYHATSRRVILVSGPSDEAQTHELHYGELEGILEVCASDHKRMVLGAVMVVAGLLTMFVWFLIMPIVAHCRRRVRHLTGIYWAARLLPIERAGHAGP